MQVITGDADTQSVLKSKRSKEADYQNLRKPFVNESIFSKSCSSTRCIFPKEKDSIMSFSLGILLNYSEQLFCRTTANSAGIYLFKFKNGNTREMCEICSKLAIKTPERHH